MAKRSGKELGLEMPGAKKMKLSESKGHEMFTSPISDSDSLLTLHLAHQLYLNGKYDDALDKYKASIGVSLKEQDAQRQPITKDNKFVFLQILKTLDKLSQKDSEIIRWQKGVVKELFETEEHFPSHIQDRQFLVDKALNLFGEDRLMLDKIPHTKILSTISYIKYWQQTKPGDAQQFFLGQRDSGSLLELYASPSFDTLLRCSHNNVYEVLSNYYKFGLLGPVLCMQNVWKDTVAHKLIRSNAYDYALEYLRYAAKFDDDFFKKYLHDLSNYQKENWLYDIATNTQSKNLVSGAIKILSDKKLEHFILLNHCQTNYMKYAIDHDNSSIVREVLESIQKRNLELGFCQRIFNINSNQLELSERYRSHKDLDFLRSMGLKEYEDDDETTSYVESFVNDKQNVHRTVFTESIIASIDNLEKHYETKLSDQEAILSEFEKFFHSIKTNINHKRIFRFLQNHNCKIFDNTDPQQNIDTISDSLRKKYIDKFLEGAEFTLARIIDVKSFSQKYNPKIEEIAERSNFPYKEGVISEKTLQNALACVWLGITDKNSLHDGLLSDEEIWDRKISFIMTLYDVYKEGIDQKSDSDVKMTDSDDFPDKKIGGIICNPGLFDRMVSSLDRIHDCVQIEIKEPEMRMTLSSLRENISRVFSDIIVLDDVPTPLMARIYNNFEKFKTTNICQEFVPLKQYHMGLLKKAFLEEFESNFFGNKEVVPSNKDYIAFEHILSEVNLPNPIEQSLNYITNSSVDAIKSNMLFAKLLMYSFKYDDSFPFPQLFKTKIYHQLAEHINNKINLSNELSSDQKKVLDLALELDMEKYNTSKIQELVSEQPVLNFLNERASLFVEQNQNITKKAVFLEIAKMIRSLAENKEWQPPDILQFQEIIKEQGLYPRQAIITDLFKHSVIQENLPMLQRVLHKAEEFCEAELIDSNGLHMDSYINFYLEKIATKDFGNGFNILHIASIHCKSVDQIFDTILNFHEFRNHINKCDKDKNTPCYSAAFNNNDVAIKKLAEYGADINKINTFGSAPIHALADKGNFELIQHLIENHAANPFVRDNNGNTFMHIAALNFDGDKSRLQFIEDLKNIVPISETIFEYDSSYISEMLAGVDSSSKDYDFSESML